MKQSLLNTTKGICYRCGRYGITEKHHIFGAANRGHAESDGLFVYLCPACHNRPPQGAHFNRETMEWLHKIGQDAYEGRQILNGATPAEARAQFMRRYGKNYL